ncbi:MAG: hypothetical protein Kow0069_39160 [Promethearchaeota archaeon]
MTGSAGGVDPLAWTRERLARGLELLDRGKHARAGVVLGDLLERVDRERLLPRERADALKGLVVDAWFDHAWKRLEEKDLIRAVDAWQRGFLALASQGKFEDVADRLHRLVLAMMPLEVVPPAALTGLLDAEVDYLARAGREAAGLQALFTVTLLRRHATNTKVTRHLFSRLEAVLKKLKAEVRPALLAVLVDNALDFFEVEANERPELAKKLSTFLKPVAPPVVRDALPAVTRAFGLLRAPAVAATRERDSPGANLLVSLEAANLHDWALLVLEHLAGSLSEAGATEELAGLGLKFVDHALGAGRAMLAVRACRALSRHLGDATDDAWVMVGRFLAKSTGQWPLLAEVIGELFERALESASRVEPDQRRTAWLLEKAWELRARTGGAEPDDFWSAVFHRAVTEEGDAALAKWAVAAASTERRAKFGLEAAVEKVDEWVASLPPREKKRLPLSADASGRRGPARLDVRFNCDGTAQATLYADEGRSVTFLGDEAPFDHELPPQLFGRLAANYYGGVDPADVVHTLILVGRAIHCMLPLEAREALRDAREAGVPLVVTFSGGRAPTLPPDLIHDGSAWLHQAAVVATLPASAPPRANSLTPSQTPTSGTDAATRSIKLLVLGDFNATWPKYWDEEAQQERVSYPFPAAGELIGRLVKFASERPEVGVVSYASGAQASKDAVLEALAGGHGVVHVTSNLFHVEGHPAETHFVAADGETLTIGEVAAALGRGDRRDVLVALDARVYDASGTWRPWCAKECLAAAGELLRPRGKAQVAAVVTKTADSFGRAAADVWLRFYERVLEGVPLGQALREARAGADPFTAASFALVGDPATRL